MISSCPLQIEIAYRKLQEKFAKERRSINDGAGEYGLDHPEADYDADSKGDLEFDIKVLRTSWQLFNSFVADV